MRMDERQSLCILVTEEDKTGRDISKMSNFFDGYIQNLSSQILQCDTVQVTDVIQAADIGIINEVVCHAESLLKGKYSYIPDFDSLPRGIRTKLQKGIYTVGESRQVEGNMRAVILDENGVRIKDITLKKVLNDPGTLEMTRNIANQLQLKQISAKIGVIQELQNYQIDRDRDRDIIVPFLNARDYILRAQIAATIEERRENLLKASDKLTDAINSVYSDIETTSKWLSRLTTFPIFQITPVIQRHIGQLAEDLQLATRYVGLQMQVFDCLQQKDNALLEFQKYRVVMYDFSEKALNRKGQSALTIMQGHSTYDESNRDCWYTLKEEIQPFIKLEQTPIEEVYLISAEDCHETEK